MQITALKTFVTQPGAPHNRLVVVRVETNQAGLYGLGCATYTQRWRAVVAALEHHLGPRVIGRDPAQIEDIWHTLMLSGYWRNGPVLNNAVSGIDMALWDIKGKSAGMPCYELWGGKCRPGAVCYTHANGADVEELIDHIQAKREQGWRHVRCQLGGYSGRSAGESSAEFPGIYYDPAEKVRRTVEMFEAVRAEFGDGLEVLHDVHERLGPMDTIRLAKALEPCRLFFLEDVVAPEDQEWLKMLRGQTCTPIAMGELFNNPLEIVPFASRRLFDFLRVHISQVGGITPALKLAHFCEPLGIRTAWHGPGDTSPVGMAAGVHLDLALHNFGIQEWAHRGRAELDIFPGTPRVEDGVARANDEPGLGIGFNEELAAEFPPDDAEPDWTSARWPDGTIWRP